MRINPSFLPVDDSSKLSMFGRLHSKNSGRCWPPSSQCDEPPINCHSIQNSRILDALHDNGQLYQIQSKVESKGLRTGFRLIGRNKVSTFKGFCKDHDREIFEPIDQGDLKLDLSTQRHLLMWRAITSEMTVKLSMGRYFQSEYLTLKNSGEIKENEPHPFGHEAVMWMKVGFDFWEYRQKFWSPLIADPENKPANEKVLHKSFVLKDTGPVLAAASFFAEYNTISKREGNLGINVWPFENDTHVLVSYTREDIPVAPKVIREFLLSKKMTTEGLSALLLSKVQNFVIRPSIVDSWTKEKKKLLVDSFTSTVDGSAIIKPNPKIDLFI